MNYIEFIDVIWVKRDRMNMFLLDVVYVYFWDNI